MLLVTTDPTTHKDMISSRRCESLVWNPLCADTDLTHLQSISATSWPEGDAMTAAVAFAICKRWMTSRWEQDKLLCWLGTTKAAMPLRFALCTAPAHCRQAIYSRTSVQPGLPVVPSTWLRAGL